MPRSKVLNVQLITLVQTYPVLYDGLAAATKQQKTLAWQQIASLLKADGNNIFPALKKHYLIVGLNSNFSTEALAIVVHNLQKSFGDESNELVLLQVHVLVFT